MNFSFGKRIEQVDWRKLASVDLDRLARDMDVKTLQENIMHVTYCNIEAELGMQAVAFDPNFLKLFRLTQLIIEYLLHSQEYLSTTLEEEVKKVQDTMQSAEQVRKELEQKSETQSKLKKEIRKLKKWIAEYQLMMRAGASGIHKCPFCAKAFVSQEYLIAHLTRRHDDHSPLMNGSVPSGVPIKPLSVLVSSKLVNGETDDSGQVHVALLEEMKQIKDRLYATERELMNEKSAREMQNAKERSQLSSEQQKLIEIEENYEQWKKRDDEKHKRELETLRQSLRRELQTLQAQNQEEKHVLSQALTDLELKMRTRPSMIGSIRDEDELDSPPVVKPSKQEIAELVRGQFEGQLQQIKVQTQEDMQREMRKLNQKWKGKEESIQNDHNNEMQKVQEIIAQYGSQLEAEHAEKERLGQVVQNLTKKLQEHDKALISQKLAAEEYQQAAQAKQQPVFATPPMPRREVTFSDQDFMNRERVKTPDTKDGPDDALTLYVSANTSRNQYRVWRQKSDGSSEWVDKFSFCGYIKPLGPFMSPLYVYTASGSPYWRQFISSTSSPPSTEYRMEYMFYVSSSPVLGAVELHLLEAGTLPVIRSCVSKSKNLQGWKSKGVSFYAMKSGGNLNAASLSGSWDMDSTLTDGKRQDSEESESELEEEPKPPATPEIKVTDPVDDSSESTEDLNELTSGVSTSEWGTGTLQRGEFHPYSHNPDITTHYRHTLDEVVACRQEIEQFIEQKLAKQGIQPNTKRLSSQKMEARMSALKTERQARAKKSKNYNELRASLAKESEDMADRNYYKTKTAPSPQPVTAGPRQGSKSPTGRVKPPTFRSAATAVRTSTSLVQQAMKSSTKSSTTLSSTGSADMGSSYGDQSFSGTSVTERTLSESEGEEDYSDESDWDSGGNIPLRTPPARPLPRPIPANPKVSVRIPTQEVDSDPEELQPAPQRNSFKPEPRGEKVRELTNSLERILNFGSAARKPVGGVAIPGKEENFDDDDSDFSLSSLDEKPKPVPVKRSEQSRTNQRDSVPVPAARTRPVPSPRNNGIKQHPKSSAVMAFTVDDYSDFDDSDLDVHHIT